MKIETRFFYVDIGRPWWRGATERLAASARKHMPDCAVVQITNTTTPTVPGTHYQMREQSDVSEANLMLWKGALWAVTGLEARVPTILVDADVEFCRDVRPLFAGDWDVAVVRRSGPQIATAQPYLAAVMLTKPTAGAVAFWAAYYRVLSAIPKALHPWWCDQLALALMVGIHHNAGEVADGPGWRVAVLNADDVIGEGRYLTHYKGHHKEKQAA